MDKVAWRTLKIAVTKLKHKNTRVTRVWPSVLVTDILYSKTTRPCTLYQPQECFSITWMCEGQRVSGCKTDSDNVTVTNMTFHMSISWTPNGDLHHGVHVRAPPACGDPPRFNLIPSLRAAAIKHVSAPRVCIWNYMCSILIVSLYVSVFLLLMFNREIGLFMCLWVCVSPAILCGDSYFGFAVILYCIRMHAVVTVVVLKHISIFC